MLKITQDDFIAATRSAVDAYVHWASNSMPYRYYDGDHGELLRGVVAELKAYFTNFRPAPAAGPLSFDGRGGGGGRVLGPRCSYGTMECIISLHFYDIGVAVCVYRYAGEVTMIQPAYDQMLLEVYYRQGEPYPRSVAHFQNILK